MILDKDEDEAVSTDLYEKWISKRVIFSLPLAYWKKEMQISPHHQMLTVDGTCLKEMQFKGPLKITLLNLLAGR